VFKMLNQTQSDSCRKQCYACSHSFFDVLNAHYAHLHLIRMCCLFFSSGMK